MVIGYKTKGAIAVVTFGEDFVCFSEVLQRQAVVVGEVAEVKVFAEVAGAFVEAVAVVVVQA
ncbi:unnamed protein product, partial [Brugia timori]|uniref:Lipoyl-binding domain-containing protein n=1 Tax=Brugia timori TaxID=42155 RepID=A0A0R3QJ12_9BILA